MRDIDGNTYNTVSIGFQCWTKENLKVTKYNNGKPIPTGLNSSAWRDARFGAYTIYNNDNANDEIYGKLYNWFAVADNRGLCPTGWHVPTNAEWITLTTFLGGESVAGGKMKSTSSLWSAPNTDATNSSGFTALPGGCRGSGGSFSGIRNYPFFWSATEDDSNYAWNRGLYGYNGIVTRDNYGKQSGYSVRCLRD